MFPFFYTYKKDDNNNMTENKDFEIKDFEIKDLISLDNIMIENNLDFKEAKVEQEGLQNTYFKQIYRRYTQFECEKEPLVWSMKRTYMCGRDGNIKLLLTFKPS